eukprot:1691617-Karenia_brevis.AAC.1
MWMRERGWVSCPWCNKIAVASRRGGIHESCAAAMRLASVSQRDDWAHLDDGWEEGGWAAVLQLGSLVIVGCDHSTGLNSGGYAPGQK